RDVPPELLVMCLSAVLALPVYLAALTFLTDWMARVLDGPKGPARLKIARVSAVSWLFTMLWCAGFTWHSWPTEPDWLTAILVVAWLTPVALVFPYELAVSSANRARYHAEWARLDLN